MTLSEEISWQNMFVNFTSVWNQPLSNYQHSFGTICRDQLQYVFRSRFELRRVIFAVFRILPGN